MFQILVIDDDKNTRFFIKEALEFNHYNIFTASNGVEGLKILENKHIDLVIVDIMMPEMDGYQFTKELREFNSNIPILMMSAKQLSEDRKKGFVLGIDDYMTKPLDLEELLLHVKALLRRYESISERKLVIENILLDIDAYKVKKGNEEIYTILCDEFSNMYSYNVIDGIVNNNKNSIKLFDISYNNIFRMLNKKVPNINAFQDVLGGKDDSKNNNASCRFVKKNNSIVINNDSDVFTSFSVYKGNDDIYFKTDADLTALDSIDIYIDMNNIAYTGSQKMLKPVNAFFVPEHSWEFAVRITQKNIYIYKHLADSYDLIDTIPNENENANITISSSILKGNPLNWSYQTVAIKGGEVFDFIENTSSFMPEQRGLIIKLIKDCENLISKKASLDEIKQSETIIKIKNWMKEAQEAEDLKIDEYEDLISNLNSILINCNSEIITQYIIKYMPYSYNDKNINKAKIIRDLINESPDYKTAETEAEKGSDH